MCIVGEDLRCKWAACESAAKPGIAALNLNKTSLSGLVDYGIKQESCWPARRKV